MISGDGNTIFHCSAHLRSVMLKSLCPIIYYNHGDVSDLLLRRI